MSITNSTACNHDNADYYLKNQSSKISSTPILRCTEEIDLGVVFDTKYKTCEYKTMKSVYNIYFDCGLKPAVQLMCISCTVGIEANVFPISISIQ